MGFAFALAICLCGQDRYTNDDSLNQWESHLLESRWIWRDEAPSPRRILFVQKFYVPDHRTFELYFFDKHENEDLLKAEVWTGTYKLEAREFRRNQAREYAEKLLRLEVEQCFVTADGGRPENLRNWTETKDFRPFFVELLFNATSGWTDADVPPGCQKFRLRSDDVKKLEWWRICQDYIFAPIAKRNFLDEPSRWPGVGTDVGEYSPVHGRYSPGYSPFLIAPGTGGREF